MENKFQRQQRIIAAKNAAEADHVKRHALDIYGIELNEVRSRSWLRDYAFAAWACVVQEEFSEE